MKNQGQADFEDFKEKLWLSVKNSDAPWEKNWKLGERMAPYNPINCNTSENGVHSQQYIAWKSCSRTLQSENPGIKLKQWTHDEFVPIAQEIGTLFEVMEWLKKN